MTDEELRAIEARGFTKAPMHYKLLPRTECTLTVGDLVAEVRRLRGLIEDTKSKDICPWCGGENWYQIPDPNGRSVQGQCFKDCPAFAPDGTVR